MFNSNNVHLDLFESELKFVSSALPCMNKSLVILIWVLVIFLLCPPVLVASVPRQPAGPQVVVLGVFGPPLLRGNAPARAGEAELRGLPGCAEYIFILSEREAWEPKYKLDRTLFPTVDQWTARVTVYLL